MQSLIVKTEGKPIKCEICHQSDVFDVATQVCLRCQDLASVPSASKPVETFSGEDRVSFFRRLNAQFDDSLERAIVLQREFQTRQILTTLLVGVNLGSYYIFSILFKVILEYSSFLDLTVYWLMLILIVGVSAIFFIHNRHAMFTKGIPHSALRLALIPGALNVFSIYFIFFGHDGIFFLFLVTFVYLCLHFLKLDQ